MIKKQTKIVRWDAYAFRWRRVGMSFIGYFSLNSLSTDESIWSKQEIINRFLRAPCSAHDSSSTWGCFLRPSPSPPWLPSTKAPSSTTLNCSFHFYFRLLACGNTTIRARNTSLKRKSSTNQLRNGEKSKFLSFKCKRLFWLMRR